MSNHRTPFFMNVAQHGQRTIVAIHGSAGMAEAEEIRRTLEELAARCAPVIVLDLSEMDFICSVGLGAIITGHLKSRHHQGEIRLVNPQENIQDLLHTTKLTKLFAIYPTLEQALAN